MKRRTKTSVSAAERRICALAPKALTLDEAVKHVVAELMQGVACPPTDLEDVGRKLGVQKISYESFSGRVSFTMIKMDIESSVHRINRALGSVLPWLTN